MASTPEARVKAAVKKILDAEGVYYFTPIGTQFGKSGVPDIICCVMGLFLAIECKAGKGKTTALQERELSKIRTADGVAIVINEHNTDEVRECVQALKDYR